MCQLCRASATNSGESSKISVLVNDSSAIYPIIVDPLVTSPSWTAESDQADATFGWSVGTAGDVNGDGYSDVIVGAIGYDNGETDEAGHLCTMAPLRG